MKKRISLLLLLVVFLLTDTDSQNLGANNAGIGFSVTQQIIPVLIGKKDNPVIRIQIPVSTQTNQVLSAVTIQLKGTTSIKDLQSL